MLGLYLKILHIAESILASSSFKAIAVAIILPAPLAAIVPIPHSGSDVKRPPVASGQQRMSSQPLNLPNPPSVKIPPPNLQQIDPRIEQKPVLPSVGPSLPTPAPSPIQVKPSLSPLLDEDSGTLRQRPNQLSPSQLPKNEPPRKDLPRNEIPSPVPSGGDPTFDSTEPDDLGIIRIRPTPSPAPTSTPAPTKPPTQKSAVPKSLYLLGRLDYFHSSNVFSSPLKQSDGALRSGLSLYYAPALGSKTYLLAFAEAGLLRYGTVSRLNSDELRLKLGLYHQWTPRFSTEVGWSYYQLGSAPEGFQQLFQGKRFFNEQALRFEATRQDQPTPNLKFATLYQFRWNLVGDVDNYDRLVNTIGTSLSYKLTPKTQLALDYYLTWTHFTQQARDDTSHYLGARISHSLNDRLQLSLFGGHSFGRSSDRRLDFEGWLFGGGLSINVPIF